MSVRSSLVAILTMGPAYGFQLHGELQARTAERRRVNVGQIYSTLERLLVQGVVESIGTTADGLPLYGLTDRGEAEAAAWLHDTTSVAGDEWTEMLERVLIASSLPGVDIEEILAGYRRAWEGRRSPGPPERATSGQAVLSDAADTALRTAALAWLDTVDELMRDRAGTPVTADGNPFHRELSVVRPKRGRRPTSGYLASA